MGKTHKQKNPTSHSLRGGRAKGDQRVGDVKHEVCRGHHLGWWRRFALVPVDEDSIEASRADWRGVSTHRCAHVQLHQLWHQQSVHFDAI